MMGNIAFQVVPSETQNGREATVRIQAVSGEFRNAIKGLLEEAVAEGIRVAKENAPRGEDFHHDVRLSDAIVANPVKYHPGGAGGGGFYEASYEATNEIAPHLRWVFEGTGIFSNRGEIKPSHGNVFPIQKHGEPVHYRMRQEGQPPQQRWWYDAQEHTETFIAAGIRSLQIP